jgi:hypothetical protein
MPPRHLCNNLLHKCAVGMGFRKGAHVLRFRADKPVMSGKSRRKSAESRSRLAQTMDEGGDRGPDLVPVVFLHEMDALHRPLVVGVPPVVGRHDRPGIAALPGEWRDWINLETPS